MASVPVPYLASNPGLLLAPKDFTPEMLRPLASNDYDWNPERSPSGPITMVVSAADKAIYVYRNGNLIGRAAVEVEWPRFAGQSCFLAARRHDRSAKLAGSGPGRAKVDDRDEQWPRRSCRQDRVAPAR